MYVQYDIDIISILILAVVYFNNLKNSGESIIKQTLFQALIICDILLLIFDMIILIIIGVPGLYIHILLEVLQAFFFAFCSLFCFLWALFCTIRSGYNQKGYQFFILCIPFLLLVVFLVFNYSNGFIYRITQQNTYERGDYFHITSACTYSYVIYSIILILKNKRNLTKNEFYPYLIAPLIPMSLGIVQLVLSIDVLMVWPGVAVSVLIMHLYVLSEKINLDHLTGLYNRKYLDDYIEDMLQLNRINYSTKSKKKFAAIMLDIDNFKNINDTYGHVEGDNAIVIAAGLLNKSVRKGDFVSRYGGDEFLIILDQCDDDAPKKILQRIEENVQKYNSHNELPYLIEFSIGYKVYKNSAGLTSKEIFSGIDKLMYKNKQSKIGKEYSYTQTSFDI
ncbi:MAG: GGDEF domain-containing protein [Eubacteriales bacterium]|nr:GGDEF domain-containing protein [Eubacteriales bacterium]